jgi:hypothetical protein
MFNKDKPSRREKRREEREVFGRRGTATQYRMRERLFSFGDDFWIQDAQGDRVFKVDGKMLRVRDTLFFEDRQGNQVCKIQEKLLTIKDAMTIEGADGESLATVKEGADFTAARSLDGQGRRWPGPGREGQYSGLRIHHWRRRPQSSRSL